MKGYDDRDPTAQAAVWRLMHCSICGHDWTVKLFRETGSLFFWNEDDRDCPECGAVGKLTDRPVEDEE